MGTSILLALSITLMYSAPLMFAGLGGVISENAGVVNIGIEGMMTIGAFAGATVGYFTASPWLGFLAGGLAGGLLALIHAVACISFRADQTISGVAINFLGPGIALFLGRKLFEGSTMTKPVPNLMPTLFGDYATNSSNLFLKTLNVRLTIPIVFIFVFIMWFVLYKTSFGLRIRSVGENPAAADTLGINVNKVKYLSVFTSGILSGFGGAAMTLAVVNCFTQSTISGQGFIALAAVIFGKWKPQGTMAACLLFGFAQALVVILGGSTSIIQIPPSILSMLPYVLTLIILVVFVGNSTAPKADGIPYYKGK
ncbi:ABC transporter permease [Clostridium estertheticum]|uniref:ABC transporter permease n=1 Tax=Clostridium estertheticum TaxID=238834 RepID=UPI001C0D8DE8|nr:ABC transporter permease [Clostridium estertheticum]MBU3215072.1 ABC transporter permease [Clostridium estertheticum]WAG55640.1 ABC transporter permease [Clostridium estertheticum]